ncbi:large subunit ribosomal protein L24 [Stackebrandtia albiflava]|uniref:Large ribosomal subunit protein uL24 n=1 Tax=Stackebrandtia albiflava TaxID=406432 RepID=A0A562V3I0_9ACTN|nr:50S ribosomal protein L24 [Stackebrandtia albiflava]TWJ12367.1 large subunit ribosomal protein L24 [Stackebrandtia albiflava]
MKIKKNDRVRVVAGKDRGSEGKVIETYPERNRVLVEGVNRITKHTKIGQSNRGSKTGGIVTQEAPIHVSNVMVLDADNQPTRVGYRRDEDGRKVRISRRTGKDL